LIDDRLLRSVQLWSDLATLPEYVSASMVMAFVGVEGEPDTDTLFAKLRRDGKSLVLPRMVDGMIRPALPGDALIAGPHNIPEPTGVEVDVAELDLVLVPALAFTSDGVRLGRGGGHYDRFLALCSAPTIGLCFAEQVVDELPVELHDVRVGRILVA
ncbi:MAG: 5-formyltetrahydrofolate cyclo-ligase, partial [Ilumatobacteraceae bacterium]